MVRLWQVNQHLNRDNQAVNRSAPAAELDSNPAYDAEAKVRQEKRSKRQPML